MYDPSGDKRLEGDDIIARLADYLEIDDDEDLKRALLELVQKYKSERGGCGCGD